MQYVWRDRVAQALRKFMYLATHYIICNRLFPSKFSTTSKLKSISLYVSVLHGQR